MIIDIITQSILWIWFFGAIVTYKFGEKYLVEGMGIKSAEFIMLCIYSSGIAFNYVFISWGKWVLLSALVFWLVIQFLCHWYYTIFGASEAKLTGYNNCFKNTIKIFKASDKRIIPDLYHIVLHILIIVNIITCII